MAYAIVPKKSDVMCEGPCTHRDCQLWREFFASTCAICHQPFEEGEAYYQIEPGQKLKDERQWVHAICYEREQEEMSEKRGLSK
jgi:hypothetical protein